WPSSKRLSPARSATDTVATGPRRRSVLLALLHPVPLALGAQEVIEHGSAGRCRNFAGTARRLAGTARRLAGPCRGIIAARGRSVGNRFAECAAVTAVMRTLTPGMAELRCVLRLGRLRFVSGAVGVLRGGTASRERGRDSSDRNFRFFLIDELFVFSLRRFRCIVLRRNHGGVLDIVDVGIRDSVNGVLRGI